MTFAVAANVKPEAARGFSSDVPESPSQVRQSSVARHRIRRYVVILVVVDHPAIALAQQRHRLAGRVPGNPRQARRLWHEGAASHSTFRSPPLGLRRGSSVKSSSVWLSSCATKYTSPKAASCQRRQVGDFPGQRVTCVNRFQRSRIQRRGAARMSISAARAQKCFQRRAELIGRQRRVLPSLSGRWERGAGSSGRSASDDLSTKFDPVVVDRRRVCWLRVPSSHRSARGTASR